MQHATLAHTIVDVPEHIYRVPAYHRKHTPVPTVDVGCIYRLDRHPQGWGVMPAIEIHKAKPGKLRTCLYRVLWGVGLVTFFVVLYLLGAMLQR